MSKFEIVVRGLFAALFVVIGDVINTFVDRWILTQNAPALMFSNGPEQTFGQDLIRLGGDAALFVGFLLAGLVIYPVVKYGISRINKKENVDEAA